MWWYVGQGHYGYEEIINGLLPGMLLINERNVSFCQFNNQPSLT